MIRRADQRFLIGALLLQQKQLIDDEAKTQGGGFGIDDGQVKIRIILQDGPLCDAGCVEGSRDPGGKTHVDDAVAVLGIRTERGFEHVRIDMIGLDVPAHIIQDVVEFFGVDGDPVQIVHIVDDDRRGDDVQVKALDDLPGHIGGGICDDLQHSDLRR